MKLKVGDELPLAFRSGYICCPTTFWQKI